MKFKYLSHVIQKKNPVFGRAFEVINIEAVTSKSYGDPSNTFKFTMGNHWGTHIDCPAHFFEQGKKVSDYPPETWFFKQPFVVELNLRENEIVTSENFGIIPEESDLILIRSGFDRYRGTEKYGCYNPGISPEVGYWLRREHPSVRALGFDFISLSLYQNREFGREAHRAFLDPHGYGSPVLIIEDMNLPDSMAGLLWVWVVPLIMETVDSSPCTVIGAFNTYGDRSRARRP